MKILTLIATIMCPLMMVTPAVSGEITDKEWTDWGSLVVTYYSGKNMSSNRSIVECTAFNSRGKPIGGGGGMSTGGVARVAIDIPKKYYGQNLRVVCSN